MITPDLRANPAKAAPAARLSTSYRCAVQPPCVETETLVSVHRDEKQWFAEDQPTFDLGAVDVSRADVELKAFGTPCVFGRLLMLGALIYPPVRGTQSCQSVASTPNGVHLEARRAARSLPSRPTPV